MKILGKISLLVLALFLNQNIFAQGKIKITKADELPRRSVTINGKAVDVVNDITQLNQLNDAFIANLEADLEKYEIADKATLKAYYLTLMGSYFFKENYEKCLSYLALTQAITEKNAEKLTMATFLRAYIASSKQVTDVKSDAFKQTFAKEYAAIWNNLPYEEVKEEVESNKASLGLFNPELVTSGLEQQLQPMLDNNKGVVPEGIVSSLVGIKIVMDKRIALIPEMLKVMTALYEKNKSTVVKKDIWTEREITLQATDKATPVVVAVWDSGTDMSIFPDNLKFKDKSGKNGLGYSLIDYKKDGLLLENPEGRIKSDIKRLQTLTKGFMDLQSAINSSEAAEIQKTYTSLKKEEVKTFSEELSFYGNYAHGTHVAGIVMKGNPFARLMAIRMGFEYRTLPPAHTMANAAFQAKMYEEIVKYLKENKVRVVNMSWRYNSAAYEGLLSLNGIGKDDEDRKRMANEMFKIEKEALYKAFKSAPEILFVCGSGNENNDAGFEEYIPASFIDLPNLITIGAVDSEGKKTSFTTEGKSVRFYANGFEVESFVPGGDKIKFSGTSMSSPQVVNLASKILALNPGLSPIELISLIEKGSDNLPENPNLRLINPKKTLELVSNNK